MLIKEILNESPDEIRLLLSILGHDMQVYIKDSSSIKDQYLSNPTNVFKIGMHTYLNKINQSLYEMANIPQWEVWISTSDGQHIMKDIENLYNSNLEFMNKYK